MALIQSQSYLGQYFPNYVLSNVVMLFFAPPDDLSQVSSFTVLHNDRDFIVLLVNDAIVVFDNVWVIQFAEDVYLID